MYKHRHTHTPYTTKQPTTSFGYMPKIYRNKNNNKHFILEKQTQQNHIQKNTHTTN